MSSSVPEMVIAIEELQTIHANSGDVIRKDLSGVASSAITLKAEGLLTENIRDQEVKNLMDIYLSEPSQSPEEIIAIGSDGTPYKAYTLYNTRVILGYKENGQDIIFAGQINENNHWDGRCVFNVFENGEFVIATEVNYDDGERLYYEQLYPKGDEWAYSERYSHEDSNSGDTWTYSKEKDISFHVNINEPREEELIVPKEFIIPMGKNLTGHYHGDTANGLYNDESDQSYSITYDDKGFVKTVYKGRFVNGVYNDTTGNAWYITRESYSKADINYQYYKGDFRDGHPVPENERKKNAVFDEKITLDEAERIVNVETFSGEIKWNENRFYSKEIDEK